MSQPDVVEIFNLLSRNYYGRNIRHLDVKMDENKTIVLMGQTSHFFMKQVAQELVKSQLPAGFLLNNKIEVVRYTN